MECVHKSNRLIIFAIVVAGLGEIVGAVEHDVARRWLEPGLVEQCLKRHAGPFADATPTLHAVMPRDLRACRHGAQVWKRQLERLVDETDFKHGHVQYAMHKIFNEWQAQDYREKHGMEITTIRPANVTGPDKIVGSVDHVYCITTPARGKPVSFPYKDAMRCPVHVDEIAEIFARVIMTDKPKHMAYNTGGQAISLGELADIVRAFLPDAKITFDKEVGGKELSGNYLIDNTRLVQEFGVQYRPYRERVLQIINDIRREEGLPLVSER